MPSISGSFSAHVTAETTLFPDDQPNHQLQIAEIHTTQKSPDPNWNNSQLIYHGVTDLVAGTGTQHGYYVNEHADGDRDCGTFEGNVTMAGEQATIDGTFTFTSGTGKFKGIHGDGNFKGRQISPTEIEMNWTGTYEVAAGTRAA
jgi:hypothetical protein